MNNKTLAAVVGATAAAVISTQIPILEGTKYVPYYDKGHILTVCSGVTNPVPILNKVYSKEECEALDAAIISEHAKASVKHLPSNAKNGHIILAVLAGYNLGPKRILDSGLPEKIAKNDPSACSALVKYHFVAKQDCSIRSNGCYGVYTRRLLERKLCEEYNEKNAK